MADSYAMLSKSTSDSYEIQNILFLTTVRPSTYLKIVQCQKRHFDFSVLTG